MRRVHLPGTGIETSCLGFGCASLGSRVSPEAGQAAMARAFDAGLRWFDVAPPYGGGEAEALLGRFLRQHRDEVQVLTKVGLAPPRSSAMLKLAYRLGRPLLATAAGLRRQMRGSTATRLQRLTITPDLIRASIDRSLRALGTDRVDVYALHDPDPACVSDPAVVAALESVVAAGKARHVGIAGDLEACRAGAAPGLPYRVFQTPTDPGLDLPAELAARAGRPVAFIGHSVFGVGGARETMLARLEAEPQARTALARAGYDTGDLAAAAGRLLLDAALAGNPQGVTLVSMFAPAHASANLARASQSHDPRLPALAAALLGGAPIPLEETSL